MRPPLPLAAAGWLPPQGVFNRVNGLVVAVTELVVFALPFSVVQYMPNFFFGALLVWFGIEISRDWLVLSYRWVGGGGGVPRGGGGVRG